MKRKGETTASSQKPFWKRILDRHQSRRRLMHPRVPLVFFRIWSATSPQSSQLLMQSYVVSYPLHLQIQFCWPSSVKVQSSYRNLQQFNVSRQSRESRYVPLRNVESQSTAVINSDQVVVDQVVQRGPAWPHVSGVVHAAESAPPAVAGESGSVPPVIASGSGSVPPAVAGGSTLSLRHSLDFDLQRSTHPLPQVVLTPIQHRSLTSDSDARAHLPAGPSGSAHIINHSTQRVFNKTQQQLSAPAVTAVAGPSRSTIQREIFLRHTNSSESRRNLEVITHGFLPFKPPMVFTDAFGADRGTSGGGLVRRNLPSVPREFLSAPAHRESKEPSSAQQTSPVTQRAAVPPPQPPVDLGRLSEEVYRHIQKKIRIERERRGL